MSAPHTSDREVVNTRILNALPAQVFQAWADQTPDPVVGAERFHQHLPQIRIRARREVELYSSWTKWRGLSE